MNTRSASLKSSGEDVSIADNENVCSGDNNPYAYPYFHSHSSDSVYDLVVKFGGRWKELGDNHDTGISQELEELVQVIQGRCEANPQETTWTDSCGDTALHRLCQVARVPSSPRLLSTFSLVYNVAVALVVSHPASATTERNNWKETPLHQFVSHCGFPAHKCNDEDEDMDDDDNESNDDNNESITDDDENESDTCDDIAKDGENEVLVDLVKLLCRDNASRATNYWRSLPLHDACGLSGCESTCTWWMEKQHLAIVTHLISQHPQGVMATDSTGQLPLDRALESLKCTPQVLRVLCETLTAQTTISTKRTIMKRAATTLWKHFDRDSDFYRHVWEMTFEFLRHTCAGNSELHAALHYQDVPFFVIQVLCANSLILVQDGNTPLCLALEKKQDSAIVVRVMGGFRGLASTTASIPNARGQLPLCVAISSHYSWTPVLQDLFDAEPRAISTRDPVTGLYPFALAAASTTSHSQQDYDSDQVNTIYKLLRIDPTVLTRNL